jgi:hypothetical protein
MNLSPSKGCDLPFRVELGYIEGNLLSLPEEDPHYGGDGLHGLPHPPSLSSTSQHQGERQDHIQQLNPAQQSEEAVGGEEDGTETSSGKYAPGKVSTHRHQVSPNEYTKLS